MIMTNVRTWPGSHGSHLVAVALESLNDKSASELIYTPKNAEMKENSAAR